MFPIISHSFLHHRSNMFMKHKGIYRIIQYNIATKSKNKNVDKKNTTYNLFLSCSPGLESIVTSEVKGLFNISENNNDECTILNKKVGGIYIKVNTLSSLYKCHLHLGTISNVYLSICKPFKARAFYELEYSIINKYMIDVWEELFDKLDSVELNISTKCSKSKLLHTNAINERISNGIYHCLGRRKPRSSSNHKITVKLVVNVYRDMFEILLNTSSNGIPLHKRGYRTIPCKAPFREDLVHALLYASGWRNNLNKDLLFIDPFCGSGTIAIEAASIIHGLPPGRLRQTPLLGTTLYNPTLWNSILNETSKEKENKITIIASDRDEGAINASKQNATNANVNQHITFYNLSFSQCLENIKQQYNIKDEQNVFIITNPPYGIRTSKKKKQDTILEMYQKFGVLVNSIFNDKISSTTTIVENGTVTTTTEKGGKVITTIVGNDRDLVRKTGIQNLQTKFMTNHGGIKIYVLSNNES